MFFDREVAMKQFCSDRFAGLVLSINARMITVSAILSAVCVAARAEEVLKHERLPEIELAPVEVLDLVGGRNDKNSVGHGKNLAVYVGKPSRYFFATHELGNVFDAVDGRPIVWYPDQVIVAPADDRHMAAPGSTAPGSAGGSRDAAPHARRLIEQRQVCVTKDDVVFARVWLKNQTSEEVRHTVTISGDCRKSFDWRGKPGGKKATRRDGDFVVMTDHHVFPEVFNDGLAIVVGCEQKPTKIEADTPGAYRLSYEVTIPPGEHRVLSIGCAVGRTDEQARKNLKQSLQTDALAENRRQWQRWYAESAPSFTCSDQRLTELYAFRWFLLRFSTAGGDLGYFKHPVVMEGRQAFQTYCCYSAPFMALDLNWAIDPQWGWGQVAGMVEAAYDDGRFPWYVSPRTKQVPIHHRSGTGLSLVPLAAWRHYQIRGDREAIERIYPGLLKNVRWWIADRDGDGDGLFEVDHQLETGMDDLFRFGDGQGQRRYEAVDATAYAYANIDAVAQIARVLRQAEEARELSKYGERIRHASAKQFWDAERKAWFDLHPENGARLDYLAITTFYPAFAGLSGREQSGVFRAHLLNRDEFWLPHPVPALPKNHRDFGPTRYWQGPSWPAANSHVIEGFASAAKRYDRTLLPQAAELFQRCAANHLQPRADFYERYNPITGEPLSTFRDYMHSWWVDLIVRHVCGFDPYRNSSNAADGNRDLTIDPLPLGLDWFELRGVAYRGQRYDVLWRKADRAADRAIPAGLTVRRDGKEILRREAFEPGSAAVEVR